MTELSWLAGHLDNQTLRAANSEAERRSVYEALRITRENAYDHEVEFTIQSLQLLLYDSLDNARTDPGTRELCKEIFRLAKTQSLPEDGSLARKKLLRICSIGWLGDQGPAAKKLLSNVSLPTEVHPESSWPERVETAIIDSWILLLRKSDWSDIDALILLISSLRTEQQEYERSYLENQGSSAHPAAWELVALYHLARAAEITATYMTEGQSDNRFDVRQQVEAHFDRAISASDLAFAIELNDLIRLLHAVSQQLLDNSLWTIARAAGPAATRFVEKLADRARQKPLFEVLPPQRSALGEQGLARASQRSVVVSLPTSSGKTLIAQFRMLQALSLFDEVKGWVAYVAPTRALVNQVTARLRRDFGSLGIPVERVSPALEVDALEAGILTDQDADESFRVLVSTPEKLDLLLRGGWESQIGRPLCLVVIDEAHNLSTPTRGLRLELLLATINRESRDAQFLLLTPFIRNPEEIARWLDPVSNQSFQQEIEWLPNDRIISLAHRVKGSKKGDYSVTLETISTSHETLAVDEPLPLNGNRPSNYTWSAAAGPNRLAPAVSLLLESRGPTITLAQRPDYSWSIAKELQRQRPGGLATTDPDVAAVQRMISFEFGSDFPLVDMIDRGIGVHHSGLSDEIRALTEWLLENNKIRHLVSTTTVAQGMNFPVANVVFATHQYPYGVVMPPEDFWNIAGRAGRVDQGQVGLIALVSPTDERADELRSFISTNVSALNSTLVQMVQHAIRQTGGLPLAALSYQPEWSSFLQFIAHTYRQIGNHEEFATEVEQVLRGTLGFQALRTSNRSWANMLIASVREYANGLAGKPLSLVDSTGFSWDSVNATLARLSSERITAESWSTSLFAGDTSPLRDMIGIMLQVPELRESLIEATRGKSDQPDFLARVISDWVNGASIPDLARQYFQNPGDDELTAITKCCSRIFGNIAPTISWGISALQSLTLGPIVEELGEDAISQLRNLPAYAFYGVGDENSIALRLLGVPRTAAPGLAQLWNPGDSDSSREATERTVNLGRLRARLRSSQENEWVQALGDRGRDYFRIWQILQGSI